MLNVEQIEKSFGSQKILKGVSFNINSGEIYGLIGKNGAGKTTLMNIMAGLSSADSGSCTLNGKPISTENNILKIGYLPDLPSFFEYLTTGEFLDYLLMGREEKRRRTLLQLVELDDKVKISTMSRGMRQRLGIAAAIVNDPDVILLDEPTSALDPSGRADVMRVLNTLKHEGKAIILSTHILADMERVCDQVGFLSDGIIKKNIKVSELQEGCAYVRVTFAENQIDSHIFELAGLQFEVTGGMYRFALDQKDILVSQKKLLNVLAGLDIEIASIHNESNNLDKLFEEVCG